MAIDLTVIVKNIEGELVEGAQVTVQPGKVTADTDAKGEATLTIDGTVNKYDVTVVDGDASQTVPFYVTGDQDSAKLEVNLEYFKQLEAKKQTATTAVEPAASWYESPFTYVGAGAAVLVIVVVAVMIIKHRRA